jgi:hypothetical protein
VGVDYNQLVKPEMFSSGTFPLRLYGGVDAAKLRLNPDCNFILPDGTEYCPNVYVSFEMLEHVEPAHCRAILDLIVHAMGPGDRFFMSTPCYDEGTGAAANHVNEMTYLALGALLEDLGFQIVSVYGTFASLRDYEQAFKLRYGPGAAKVFDALKAYYDVNYLSTVFAPLMPHLSRNCLWELSVRKAGEPASRRFAALKDIQGRWSSSEKWRELDAA